MSTSTTALPPWINERRARDLAGPLWDYVIRSFKGTEFMCETVHKGEMSRDMELDAIAACGRRAEVVDLRPFQRDHRARWLRAVE